ncbi:AraC family transcriptional regulator [Streptomonospora sp. PA3]|uniref:AraC family transcriptional regulator n=1 Tax=Streptomonospora sp. PA3 TaxID=2607326 RepID=UPI0016424525|nr:AraC family transcriptional regulator [Streptomonospora sp. PA3]
MAESGQSVAAAGERRGGEAKQKRGESMTSEPGYEARYEVRAEQPYVAIPAKVTTREWEKAAALVTEVRHWLSGKGIAAAGPPFFRYWVIGGGDREHILEVGVPVDDTVRGDGRVIAGCIPAGDYVALVHDGAPERIDGAHARLQEWAAERGLAWVNRGEGRSEVWGGRFEFYLTDPVRARRDACSIEIAYLVRGAGRPPETADRAVAESRPDGLRSPVGGFGVQ